MSTLQTVHPTFLLRGSANIASRTYRPLKPNDVRTSLLAPVFEVILSDLRSRLQGVEHGVFVVHHEPNVMNASRVVLAVALALGIAGSR